MREMKNDRFLLRLDEEGRVGFLGHVSDETGMNWAEGKEKWGTVTAPAGVQVTAERSFLANGHLQERYCFTNTTDFPVFFKRRDVGIRATFNDNYEDTDVCLAARCHAHISCGRQAFWAMALQMSGRGPHLGMKITEGSVCAYSVEREPEQESNDRGDFILHPQLESLLPGQSARVAFELFWFETEAEFFDTLLETPGLPVVRARQFTWFEGEPVEFEVRASGVTPDELFARCERGELHAEAEAVPGGALLRCTLKPGCTGEVKVEVRTPQKATAASFFIAPDLGKLAGARCRFIAEKQQCHAPGSPLDGAFLIYDNQEETIYYSHLADHNGGRERVGMGVLLAKYLQDHPDAQLEQSLRTYVEYLHRELYDRATGTVFNDVRRNNDWHRLYNYPWMSVLHLELYALTGEREYLLDSFRVMERYYLEGGSRFYGIAIPAVELLRELERAGLRREAETFRADFLRHARQIAENSLHYPPFEVRYEQSIVAPAVSCLLQAYEIYGDADFLREAEKQMKVLELFNGHQPNHLQYETAIRHWDGRWFGKYRNYGDTYPHYWSALSGMAFAQYARITGDGAWAEKAAASLRGCLNLFTPEGRASCAMVFPETVNGVPGHYYDPWANDQDWAMYFALKFRPMVETGAL